MTYSVVCVDCKEQWFNYTGQIKHVCDIKIPTLSFEQEYCK